MSKRRPKLHRVLYWTHLLMGQFNPGVRKWAKKLSSKGIRKFGKSEIKEQSNG